LFSPLSFVAVFGSRIRDGQKSGSGINIPDPQHCSKDHLFVLCSREAFQFLKLSNRSDLERKLTSLLAQLEGLEPCAQFADSLRHIQAGRS
jgi:hypothetical protein